MSIGKRLREVRGQMSQQAFAQAIGVSKGAIGSYENDKQSPGSIFIMAVCDHFKIEPRWLLKGDGPKFDDKAIHTRKDLFRHNMFVESQEVKISAMEAEIAHLKEELHIARVELDRAKDEAIKALKTAVQAMQDPLTRTGPPISDVPVSAPSAPSVIPTNK